MSRKRLLNCTREIILFSLRIKCYFLTDYVPIILVYSIVGTIVSSSEIHSEFYNNICLKCSNVRQYKKSTYGIQLENTSYAFKHDGSRRGPRKSFVPCARRLK